MRDRSCPMERDSKPGLRRGRNGEEGEAYQPQTVRMPVQVTPSAYQKPILKAVDESRDGDFWCD